LPHFKPLAVLEVKRPGLELTDSDGAQGLSYARQMEPMPPLLVITNGATTWHFDGRDRRVAP
jgi:type I site-specific restriction endonuclease